MLIAYFSRTGIVTVTGGHGDKASLSCERCH